MYNLLQKYGISAKEPDMIIDKLFEKRKELIEQLTGSDARTSSIINSDIKDIELALNSLSWASGIDITARMNETVVPQSVQTSAAEPTVNSSPAQTLNSNENVQRQSVNTHKDEMSFDEKLRAVKKYKFSALTIIVMILCWVFMVITVIAPSLFSVYQINEDSLIGELQSMLTDDDKGKVLCVGDIGGFFEAVYGVKNKKLASFSYGNPVKYDDDDYDTEEENSKISGENGKISCANILNNLITFNRIIIGLIAAFLAFKIPISLAAKKRREKTLLWNGVGCALAALNCVYIPAILLLVNSANDALEEIVDGKNIFEMYWLGYGIIVGATVIFILLEYVLKRRMIRDYKKSGSSINVAYIF